VCGGRGTRGLTTTAILFFLYLGYLALRRTGATRRPSAAKRCAIAAIIAFVDRPIKLPLGVVWQTLHQTGTVFNRRLDVKIDGSMAFTLVLAFVSFHDASTATSCTSDSSWPSSKKGLEERALEIAIAERVRVEEGPVCMSDNWGLRDRRLRHHRRA
jgi:heme exporter protein C